MPRIALPLHRFRRDRPPVVLLGGVSLVRALALARIPVIVASRDPDEPAFASRHCRARLLLPRDDGAVEALLDAGAQLSAHLGCRVPLLYGGDAALDLVHEHRDRLGLYYSFVLTDAEVAEALVAKDRFQALALERELPVPRALDFAASGPGSVRDAAGEVLVKPRQKADWHQSTLCNRLFGGDGKALVFENGAQAASDPGVALFHDQLTFQEFIPGDDTCLWSFHGFADAFGEILASFTGRKIRTYPVGSGESAFIELAAEPGLDALGREVARRCGLKGAFKMDFKRDPRDGRWWLLEINPRYNLWHYLGAAQGVNIPALAYDYLLGRPVRPAPPARTRRLRWLALSLDYKAWRQLAARGELGAGRWLASILFSRNLYSLFAWSDPMPFLRHWSVRLARKVNDRSGRVVAALRQWRSTAS